MKKNGTAKILNSVILFGCIFSNVILGCKNETPQKNLLAQEKLDVFETTKGDSLQVAFSLQPGDRCSIGNQKIEKMFAYLEVICPEKGRGWVILGGGYKIVGEDK
jgi:hypothetical protein